MSYREQAIIAFDEELAKQGYKKLQSFPRDKKFTAFMRRRNFSTGKLYLLPVEVHHWGKQFKLIQNGKGRITGLRSEQFYVK